MVRGHEEQRGEKPLRFVGGVLLALLTAAGLAGCAVQAGALSTAAAPCAAASPCAAPEAPCAAPETAPCSAPDASAPTGPLPPEAKAGEAWCRIWIPPVYGAECETVCVKPASKHKVWIPPEYGTRPKLVCCSEPSLREKVTPAVWAVKERERVICPEQDCWRRICCPPSKDLGPCEVQGECWTKEHRPAVTCQEPCPVCVAPERRCVRYQPARYKMVEERFLVAPGRCEVVCEPPVFEQRSHKICLKPGHWEWRRNEACEAPKPPPGPAPLPAIQVEMDDKAPSGAPAGVFTVGDEVRYDLTVLSDEASAPLDHLKVVFTLPPQLSYVSGGGSGIALHANGQTVTSDQFDLAVGAKIVLTIECRAVSAPPTNLIQLSASIVDEDDGSQLATETESTTIKANG